MSDQNKAEINNFILHLSYYFLWGIFFLVVFLEVTGMDSFPFPLIPFLVSLSSFVGTFVYEKRGEFTWKFGTIRKEKSENSFVLGILLIRLVAISLFAFAIYSTIKQI